MQAKGLSDKIWQPRRGKRWTPVEGQRVKIYQLSRGKRWTPVEEHAGRAYHRMRGRHCGLSETRTLQLRGRPRALNASQCLAHMHISNASPCAVTEVLMCPVYICQLLVNHAFQNLACDCYSISPLWRQLSNESYTYVLADKVMSSIVCLKVHELRLKWVPELWLKWVANYYPIPKSEARSSELTLLYLSQWPIVLS